MNQEERKTAIRRMRVLVAAACILMLLYGLRLIFLQLVNGDDFKSQATNTTDYKFTVTAARGDIVDSRGERIATSVTGYNVVLNKLLMGDEDLDGMLQKIVELLRANGENWNDTLLISQPDAAGNYTFTAEAGSTRDQKALAAMKDNLGLQQYATANDVMEKLVEDYDLASYPLSWQRTLGGIHYEMQLQAFSNVNNFIMAENVSEATVATIKEHGLSLPGVEIVETSTRSYEQSTVLPHVLGRVGKITAEKWKVTDENGQTTYPLREKGYNMNDIIGISGLESAYEEELRGKDGVETITRNSDGVIVDTALTTVPEPGHTVQLTIDSRFQKAVDKALAENIDMINRVYNTGSMKAAAGAAVVLDVKDGSVLAASNYPSFDQNLYATQYSEYSADESLPLFNRALQGLYTPGSTFKPAVAVAALDSGLINQYSTVFCNGVYTFYKGYSPRCTRHGHSGNIDVVTAIKWSCNIFFYDVGRRTTSDVYDAYAYKMGLGTRTGVEVNEATGRLTKERLQLHRFSGHPGRYRSGQYRRHPRPAGDLRRHAGQPGRALPHPLRQGHSRHQHRQSPAGDPARGDGRHRGPGRHLRPRAAGHDRRVGDDVGPEELPRHHRLQDRHPSAQRDVLRRQHPQALHQHHDGGLRPGRGR